MTAFAPLYRLAVYEPRSLDPNEAMPLTPIGGAPHTDYLKVSTAPGRVAGPIRPTAAMLSHSGMTVFTAANCVDNNLGNTGWGTDSATSGAWLQLDLGAGNARSYRIGRIYAIAGAYVGVYDWEYSDNGSSWTKAFTGMTPKVSGWTNCSWPDVGAHRYWRILLTNTPGGGPELAELELWEAGGPGDWLPYLQAPEQGQSGKIDRLDKKTSIGVRMFRIVDAALTVGNNLSRWFSAFSGDTKGKLRYGNLLVRAWESLDNGATWADFWMGRLRQAVLALPNVFELRVRELSDDMEAHAFVGTPHTSITYAGFPTLLPVGLSVDYGDVKAARPLTGDIALYRIQGVSIPTARWLQFGATSWMRSDNIITSNFLSAVPEVRSIEVSTGGVEAGLLPNFTASPARVRLKRLDNQAVGYFKIGAYVPVLGTNGHYHVAYLALGELGTTELGYMAFPPEGTDVEFTVRADSKPSKTNPLVVGDVHLITWWKDLLDGKFGFLWMPPEPLPSGRSYGDARIPIQYNQTKMAALEADARFPKCRGLITKREKRGPWLEANLLRVGNLAYYRDASGLVQPVDLRLPSDVSAVPTISDADLVIPEGGRSPTWDYDRARAITQIEAAYYSDVPTALVDLAASGDTYPEMSTAGFTELRHPVTILDVGTADLGDEPYDLDAKVLRTGPDEEINDQARATYLSRRIIDLATEIARPFGVGAPTSVLSVRRGGTGDAAPGELRKCTVTTLVDPGTNKRGGTRLVQVLERTPRGPFIEITVIDLGLSTAGGVPTLAAPTQETGNTLQGVTQNVTLNADSHPVELQYAVTTTAVGSRPAESDAAWTAIPDRLVRVSGDVSFRGLPAGKRVWPRARTFPDARVDYKLPSAWVFPGSGTGYVDLATLNAPSSPVSSNITGKAFRVSWTVGHADLPVELLMASPTTDPRVVVRRLPPGSTFYDFPGDSGLVLAISTTYRVGIRHYIAAGVVSAEVTIDVTTTATPAKAPATGGMQLYIGKS